MADGVTHMRWNLIAGAVMTGTALVLPVTTPVVRAVLVGSIFGCFINPDADIDTSTHAKHILRKVFFLGTAFVTAWTPYALNIGHRGASHVWVLGSLGRIAYTYGILVFAMVWMAGAFALFGGDPMTPVNAVADVIASRWSVWFYAAWIIQDCVHLILDNIKPEF